MSKFNWPFRVTPLSACIAVAFPMWSGAAMADATFEAHGQYDFGRDTHFGAAAKSGNFASPATSGFVGTGAVGVQMDRWDTYGAVEVESLGNGHFGGSAVTQESYASTSHMTSSLSMVYRDTLTNTSSAAQQSTFALNINDLRFAFDYGEQYYGTNRVSFAAKVFVDGLTAPVWYSTFDYDDALGGYPFNIDRASTTTGVDIGLRAAGSTSCQGTADYESQCAFYSGGFGITNYQTTVALGLVAPGQSIGIHYEVDLATETDMYGGDASVYFNDPARLSSNGPAAGRLSFDGSAIDLPAAAVPEPETYALLAAGLGLLAVARRRRNR